MSDGDTVDTENENERYEEPLPPHEDDTDVQMNSEENSHLPNVEEDDNIVQEPGSPPMQEGDEIDDALCDDDDSDDEGFIVTIGEMKQNVPFTAKAPSGSTGKLDMDGSPTINGQPIYDQDLAQMEDRPWRKPGADITDYFNYGFCEESWNMYCERQKKLRAEYGTQAAVNKALFSSISLFNPVSQPSVMTGGRQLQTIPILGQEKSTMDLANFKTDQPIIRTVLTNQQPQTIMGSGGTVGTSLSLQNVTVVDSSIDNSLTLTPDTTVPPPTVNTPDFKMSVHDFSKPPPTIDAISTKGPLTSIPTISTISASVSDGPPGVDEPSVPGSSTPPPGFGDAAVRPIAQLGAPVDTSIPPPRFNPLLPPPGISQVPSPMRLGLPNTNVPPPGFNIPPPTFAQPPPGFPPPRYGTVSAPLSRPMPLMGRPTFPPPGVERRDMRDNDEKDRDRERDRGRDRDRDRDSVDSVDEDYSSSRRRYRRRSRSYSPRISSRRHRDDRERERDSDRYREKDKDRENRSRRHRSRSNSPSYENPRRRKDEKEKEKKKVRVKEEPISRRDEINDEKDEEKRESSDKRKEESERVERDRDRDKDKDRKKRRHNRSDDENFERRERDRDKKKLKIKEEPPS